MRVERIEFERFAQRPGFPFSKGFEPVTGRIGYTWEALPGLTFYSQYATAADAAVATIFNISATRPQELTTARTYETGVKQLFWTTAPNGCFRFTISSERMSIHRWGREIWSMLRARCAPRALNCPVRSGPQPTENLGQCRLDASEIRGFLAANFNFNGKTPPNVPHFIANGGASYRFKTAWPVEVGASVRHVSDRYVWYDNAVDHARLHHRGRLRVRRIPKSYFMMVDQTRLAFRVRNITDKVYAVWSDPGYPDQVLLGAAE